MVPRATLTTTTAKQKGHFFTSVFILPNHCGYGLWLIWTGHFDHMTKMAGNRFKNSLLSLYL